jgi:hypothetical protein
MKNDQFIDAVQTVGIVTIAIVLSYVVVRFEGMLSRSADRLKRVLIHQDEIIETTDRIRRRIETIEAVLDSNKAAIAALSNRLSGKRHEGSSVDHWRTHVRSNNPQRTTLTGRRNPKACTDDPGDKPTFPQVAMIRPLAGFCGGLAVLTIFWPDRIEALTGYDPDQHNGTVEWLIAIAIIGLSAHWRRPMSYG